MSSVAKWFESPNFFLSPWKKISGRSSAGRKNKMKKLIKKKNMATITIRDLSASVVWPKNSKSLHFSLIFFRSRNKLVFQRTEKNKEFFAVFFFFFFFREQTVADGV